MARHSHFVNSFAILWAIVLFVGFFNYRIENPKWSLLFIFPQQICKQHFMANYRGRIFYLFNSKLLEQGFISKTSTTIYFIATETDHLKH